MNTHFKVAEAFRISALVIGTCLWVVYSWTTLTPDRFDRFGAVKGWDFPQFYINGRLVAEGRLASLYDPATVAAAATAYVSEQVPYVYNVYAPHVSLLFAPLGLLSYGWALAIWLCLSAGLYTWSCRIFVTVAGAIPFGQSTLATVLAASPAWWLTVQYGQLSAALLAIVSGAMALHGRGRPLAAGVVLGLLVAKPQLLLPATLLLLLAGETQLIAGIAVSATLQVGMTALVMGVGPLVEYARMVLSFGDLAPTLQAKRHLLQSFSAFWGLLLPTSPRVAATATALCSVAALGIGSTIWRRAARTRLMCEARTSAWTTLGVQWSALLCATTLASPHFYVYDLLVLTPVLVALLVGSAPGGAPRARETPAVGSVGARSSGAVPGAWCDHAPTVCAALLWLAPLISTVVAQNWSIQLTTPLVASILVLQLGKRDGLAEDPLRRPQGVSPTAEDRAQSS